MNDNRETRDPKPGLNSGSSGSPLPKTSVENHFASVRKYLKKLIGLATKDHGRS
jgi:hypothetical protein